MISEIKNCSCGHNHKVNCKVIIKSGAINDIVDELKNHNFGKPFIVADKNTFNVAGEILSSLLIHNGFKINKYIFNESPKPDEKAVGSLMMHFDNDCDVIIGVGSGVINDLCKILSNISGKYYIVVGTAPSMDGYASASSSMERDGLKVSINSRIPDVIIGDISIIKNAPERMLLSGFGDMLAKYVSICEWRISNIITNEYYCENIASLVRESLKECVVNAKGLVNRDENSVKAVMEALVLSGFAMSFAGLSRPASGIEHYFSHIWDMRGLEFGTPVDFHGIQCGVATLESIKAYEKLLKYKPDFNTAVSHIESFDKETWFSELSTYIGTGAKAMIELDSKEQKYEKDKVLSHAQAIISSWDNIIRIIKEELPASSDLEQIMTEIGFPISPMEIGQNNDLSIDFQATKDIRDKYILSRLVFDLGIDI